MDRRNFLENVLAGALAAPPALAVSSSPGEAARAAAGKELTPGAHPAWLHDGFIQAEGMNGLQELNIFQIRCGGQRRDAYEVDLHAQGEEVIRHLKDRGVEVFFTHLYMGFGLVAEMPEMEATKQVATAVHRYGMKVDTYVEWNSLMYETFFAEEPRAKEWIQCDALGQPIMLNYAYQQSFRYRPCFSNPEFLNYLKKVVRYAVEEVKTDFITFGNFDLNPEPDSCHCNGCKAGFREYLRAKYSPEERKERFGFENVSYVNPPLWNKWNPPEKMSAISDPVFQEWADYRCQVMSDALGQITGYIRSLNSEVAVTMNCHGINGGNRAWENGVDHARLLKYTPAFWSEESNSPDYLPDGRLISKIRSYKLARAYRKILMSNITDSEMAMAECLAFNQTIAHAGSNPLSSAMLEYISFYRKHRHLYVGTEDVAPVAVLRSYPSITYHNARAQLSAILVEQALIQSRIPFRLVFDADLNNLAPSQCTVLILPNSECLSDEQLRSIRGFVALGGGLIVTEQAGWYDTWRRRRATPGLQELVENQASGTGDVEQGTIAARATGLPPARKKFGHGRVVYFPEIEFDGPLPPPEYDFRIGPAFWKRPKNWEKLIEAVYWTAKDDIPLQVLGPDYLVANLVEQPEEHRRLVHLVNYNAKAISTIPGIDVKCALPGKAVAREVVVRSAGSDVYEKLNFRMQETNVMFTVPQVKTYSIVEVRR